MKRDNAILLHFQKTGALTISDTIYRDQIEKYFSWLVKADAVKNDITTNTLAIKGKGKALIISKQDGIIAGLEELKAVLSKYTNLTFIPKVKDAHQVTADTVIAEVSGYNSEILAYERTMLNIIGRMSGIATETDSIISSIAHIPNVPFVSSLRKTPLMYLDKKAVAIGGGLTHRLSLSDSILIKDNHLAMLQEDLQLTDLEKALETAVILCMRSVNNYFEIEVESLSQANTVLHTFVKEKAKLVQPKMMTILLDNFKSQDAKKFVDSLKNLPVYHDILIEASGEINRENLSAWALTGVDVVSIGALTHSPKVFNFSMVY
jgi:nicotinate-nucleotide pyrophosphorylase (carboxylating)